MAWDFDGVNQYLDCVMPAGVKAAPGGPMTMVAFVDLDSSTDGAFMCNMSGSTVFQWTEVFSSFNYGTSVGARNGPVATAQTPSAVGNPYIVVITKDTGNIAPEYTLIPWISGAPGTPVSGSMTGGGVTLGNGLGAGAGGFIRIARWGTSGSEYINGRIIALAQYLNYKNQAARETLTTWAGWLAASSLAFAMEFTALTPRVDASGNGGDETGRFGTAGITLVADPSGFFPSGGSDVFVSDAPNGLRWASAAETGVFSGLAVADSPQGIRLGSPAAETVSIGVATTDAPSGLRLGQPTATASFGTVTADAPTGLRFGAPSAVVTSGVRAVDAPSGVRIGSGSQTLSFGVATLDAPAGMRVAGGVDAVTANSSSIVDTPGGLRWGSGQEPTFQAGPIEHGPVTIYAEVRRTRISANVGIADFDGSVRRVRV